MNSKRIYVCTFLFFLCKMFFCVIINVHGLGCLQIVICLLVQLFSLWKLDGSLFFVNVEWKRHLILINLSKPVQCFIHSFTHTQRVSTFFYIFLYVFIPSSTHFIWICLKQEMLRKREKVHKLLKKREKGADYEKMRITINIMKLNWPTLSSPDFFFTHDKDTQFSLEFF
jgi:hypothetical protein